MEMEMEMEISMEMVSHGHMVCVWERDLDESYVNTLD